MSQPITIMRHPSAVDPARAFQQAVVLQHQGRLREAEQLYEAVLKSDDRHFGAVYRLGLIRLQQRKFDEAMQLFRRAVKFDKKSADAQFNLAIALTGLKRLEEAVQRYEKALVLKPSFPEARNDLGFALQLQGHHEAALVQYRKALSLRPDYAEARNNLGNALQILKQFESAIEQYEKVLTVFPNYVEARNNLGNTVAALGRYDEAIAHYQRALAIKPNYADAYYAWGNALRMLGRPDESIELYGKALASRPDYADAHLAFANALVELDRYEEAMAEYDTAIVIKPDFIEALTARGHLLLRMGRDVEAAQIFNNLVRRGQHSIDSLIALSTVPPLVEVDLLFELNKIISAGAEDKALLEDAAFVRVAALDSEGRYEEAWECLKSANHAIFSAARNEFDADTERQRTTLTRFQNNKVMAVADKTSQDRVISLFILGPSRSGKTILERLVSFLPHVRRGYESPTAVSDAFGRAIEAHALPAGTLFEDLPRALYPFCRDAYAEALFGLSGSTKVFTNTRPGNIFAADLMAAIFPNVLFLCVKRNIADTVLRIYQRRYRTGHSYAYDLKAVRDHVVWYHQAMDFLQEKFPHSVRVINYEDMVVNPASTVRTVADLCGLPMTEQPLPPVGDDRGCAAPYQHFILKELADENLQGCDSPMLDLSKR